MNYEETKKLVEETLDKIRPFIWRDGGDVQFVDFIDGIVYIKMLGACEGCSFVDATISEGIELVLMEEVPGVIGCKLDTELPKKEEENEAK